MRATLIILGLGLMSATLTAAPAGVRSVYLNGVDISAAKSQELKNVDITINERGDIFIVAPHYQVHEEDSFVPLSKYVQSMNAPLHKAPQAYSGPAKTLEKLQPAMATPVPVVTDRQQPSGPTSVRQNTGTTGADGLLDKEGRKVEPAESAPGIPPEPVPETKAAATEE